MEICWKIISLNERVESEWRLEANNKSNILYLFGQGNFTFIGEKLGKVMFVTAMLSVSRRLFWLITT